MKLYKILIFAGILLSFSSSIQSQNKAVQDSVKPKTDSTKNMTVQPKPYKEVITALAITSKGLFTIHKVGSKYYFEIPDSLFNREILIVNRIEKAAAEGRLGPWGMAGDQIGGNQIKFELGPNDKLYLKRISYWERSEDSSANGMYRSLQNSTELPIVASFDIKAFSPDSSGVVIDMTDYLNGDNNDVFFFDAAFKKAVSFLGAYQADKSYIDQIQTFPKNVEIHTVKTYSKDGQSDLTFTYEFNSSIVLLPSIPIKPREFDSRVGYFYNKYYDYDADPDRVKTTSLISHWRMEPKEADIEKYNRGELVEPKTPIIYYIDPATPKKWVPYLIQGVNDWQKAFEKAGFKNAIYAKEAPVNDPDWSLEDARHNAIVYKPSYIANASGPAITDPRTGEIMESHINWYHNVMSLLHDWYMVQTGAVDPKARKAEFDDSLMGQLIRFVSSHEVGHTLGLMHNFGASSTVQVEKLRDKKWVEENGFCPSIMDYARFNYVAQPEDHISEKGLFPRVGAYDEWAIEWGYRWLPDLKTKEAEKKYLDQWIIDRTGKDKRLWFGTETAQNDPRSQSEDLGDDAMLAGAYGIKNLKRILPQLEAWTDEPHEDYSGLGSMYKQVEAQYARYLFHVTTNIGGVMITPKTQSQEGTVIEFVSKEKQREAVEFLQQYLFITPAWLMDKKIFSLAGGSGMFGPLLYQDKVLEKLMSVATFTRLFWFQSENLKTAYTVSELLTDLETGIWSELRSGTPIDLYRRNLQKAYAIRLIGLLSASQPDKKNGPADQPTVVSNPSIQTSTDVLSIVKGHIKNLIGEISMALPKYKDEMERWHLIDLKERLKASIDPNAVLQNAAIPAKEKTALLPFGEENEKDWEQSFNY